MKWMLVHACLACLLWTPAFAAGGQDPIVITTLGAIRGTDGIVQAWKGIPYAAPPVGALRWRPPQPAAGWTGVRDATRFGNDCMQAPWIVSSGQAFSEDCLTVNVWAAKPRTPAGRPVLVFIYGGAFIGGTSGYPIYDGERLAADGAVVVSLNYRVGIFGFLAHPGLTAESPMHASGNYGLLDQIAALRWIKANVSAFGGDPHRVTVFGESAGAASIAMLMTSPLARGLFEGAIIESPVLPQLATLPAAEAGGARLSTDIAALRARSAQSLLEHNTDFYPLPASSVLTLSFPAPIVDGYCLPAQPRAAYAAGRIPAIPTLVGINADEGRMFLPEAGKTTLHAYRDWLQATFGKSAPTLTLQYPATDDASARSAWSAASGDGTFAEAARSIARGMSRHEPRTYAYLFTRSVQDLPPVPTHSEELQFVFGTLDVPGFTGRPTPDAADRRLSEVMRHAWVRFAATGNPNGAGLVAWPAYAAATDPYLEFGTEIRTGAARHALGLDAFTRFFDAAHQGGPAAAP